MTEIENVENALPSAENESSENAERETKWYVLRVVSGKERKVTEYLDKDSIRNG